MTDFEPEPAAPLVILGLIIFTVCPTSLGQFNQLLKNRVKTSWTYSSKINVKSPSGPRLLCSFLFGFGTGKTGKENHPLILIITYYWVHEHSSLSSITKSFYHFHGVHYCLNPFKANLNQPFQTRQHTPKLPYTKMSIYNICKIEEKKQIFFSILSFSLFVFWGFHRFLFNSLIKYNIIIHLATVSL